MFHVRWFLGNIFLSKYYTVWDATPYDDYSKSYLRIGLARIVPEDGSGDSPLNHSAMIGIIIGAVLLVIVIIGFVCYKRS